MGLGRFELPTSPLSGVRSSQLSYRPGHRRGPRPAADMLKHLALIGAVPEISRKVSRTQLNVRDSYAVSDHRLLIDAIKRRLSSDSFHHRGGFRCPGYLQLGLRRLPSQDAERVPEILS